MRHEDYKETLMKIQLAARILYDVDTAAALSHINHVQTVGPFLLPPMEYTNGLKNLDNAAKMLRGAAALMKAAEEVGIYKRMEDGTPHEDEIPG